MKMTQDQEIAQYVLDTGTFSFGELEEMKIDTATFFIDDIKQKFGIFENDIKKLVVLLGGLEIIHEVRYVEASKINPEVSGYAFDSEVSIPRLKDFIKHGAGEIATEPPRPAIKVVDVRLDKINYQLDINKGEKIISFKSKTKGEGLEKETKQYKILIHLWDFRWELKNGKVLRKGEFVSLENLQKGSGCLTQDATYQHIKRINGRFGTNDLPIEIIGENEKYRLIINKT